LFSRAETVTLSADAQVGGSASLSPRSATPTNGASPLRLTDTRRDSSSYGETGRAARLQTPGGPLRPSRRYAKWTGAGATNCGAQAGRTFSMNRTLTGGDA
jgi:hypothetical protein